MLALDFLYLLYSRFRLRINRFIFVVNQEGSDLRTFISLFGICLLANLVMCSVILL